MKFSYKILLWMIVVMALALGFSGYYLVNYVFETSLSREVGQALDESSILGFAFETAALNVPSKYTVLPDSTVEEIASRLETGGQSARRMLRISDEGKNVLYVSDGFTAGGDPPGPPRGGSTGPGVVGCGGKKHIYNRTSGHPPGPGLFY